MAPPKTMAISQQQQQPQQQQQQQQGDKQAAKPRKRKAKSNQGAQQNHLENIEPAKSAPAAVETAAKVRPSAATPSTAAKTGSTKGSPATVVPSERTTLRKQQVLTPATEPITESRRALPATVTKTVTPASVISKHQTDEADDIDAGIELDGSSNSGSSVKDMSEDQIKSASVSPVMAQTNLVNENCAGTTQLSAEVAPIEQLNGTLCSAVSPAKKVSTTKQQLAANQQVIDADEQQLQQKLQNKQKKPTSQDTNTESAKSSASSAGSSTTDKNSQASDLANNDKPNRLRRFSSQSRQDSQDGSLCKVCEQHVYQMERMLAEKSVYHKRCFRCHQCKIQLRVDNYSSHEGQVYCKAHHRQIFQPQVKLDTEDDVDIVAKSSK